VQLYDALAQLQRSPVVELNRAVAVAMRDGPEAGLALVDELLARGELNDYHLAHAAAPTSAGGWAGPAKLAPPIGAHSNSHARSRSGAFSSSGWRSWSGESAVLVFAPLSNPAWPVRLADEGRNIPDVEIPDGHSTTG